jgi:hypothetical protein
MLWCSATLPHLSENSRKTPFRPLVNRHPHSIYTSISRNIHFAKIKTHQPGVKWFWLDSTVEHLDLNRKNGATTKYVKNNMWGWTEPQRRIESETNRNVYHQQTMNNYDVISCYLQRMHSIMPEPAHLGNFRICVEQEPLEIPGWILVCFQPRLGYSDTQLMSRYGQTSMAKMDVS